MQDQVQEIIMKHQHQQQQQATSPTASVAQNNHNNNNNNGSTGHNHHHHQSPKSSFRRTRRRHLIGAIDQGTSSTRFLVFENKSGRLIASSQVEVKRIVPQEGWVEMDPDAIMDSVYSTIQQTCRQLGNGASKLKCIGICNQRESTVVWDAKTGKALYNVILWMDNRTKDVVDDMIDSVPGRDFNYLKDITGLPMSTYFSAYKLKWLIDNVPIVSEALKENRLLFGTVDSWILWNLTHNHLTDVTNASRTFLMDIEKLEWSRDLCKQFNIPMKILPKILASADDFGEIQHGPLKGLPITGVIGDQSAALFGHNCLQLGQTKATYGTGCFIMQNIGSGLKNGLKGVKREAKRGLITTVGFKLRDQPVCYALEGSIKIAGAALTWMRDNIQLINNYDECDQLVNKTTNSAGVFFVPALGGLYSPYWDPNAAGLFIGLSQFTRREHLVRATFDSIAFQTNDILSLMRGVTRGLMIDGGLCKSNNMCQILADITGCQIVRPSMCETSALGAAMVAGCGAGIWTYESMLAANAAITAQHARLTPDPLRTTTPIVAAAAATATVDESQTKENGDNDYVNNEHQTHLDDDDDEQQQQQQQHQRHNSKLSALIKTTPIIEQQEQLHNQSQARQITCRDAGGGVNDDAGGGGVHLDDDNQEDAYEDDDEVSNVDDDDENQLMTSISSGADSDDSDEDGVTTSGEFSSASSSHQCNKEVQMVMNNCIIAAAAAADETYHLHPEVHEIPPPALQMVPAAIIAHHSATTANNNNNNNHHATNTNGTSKLLGVVDETSQQQQQVRLSRFPRATPSSGYSSSDNCDMNQFDELIETQSAAKCPARRSTPVTCAISTITAEHRAELVETWRAAVKRSMQWTKVHHEEIRRADYQRLSSLPVTMYLFLSLGMVALSGFLSPNGLIPKV